MYVHSNLLFVSDQVSSGPRSKDVDSADLVQMWQSGLIINFVPRTD